MMIRVPTIETARLRLRAFKIEDAPHIRRLAGEKAIADTTLSIPHPYPEGAAEAWILGHEDAYNDGSEINFAIELQSSGELIGAVSLMKISHDHWHAELGYWIGKPFWNRGYASEAAMAAVDFAFQDLRLHRVHCFHMSRNPASGAVMRKIGMRHEGVFRQYILKNNQYEDVDYYAIIESDQAKNNNLDNEK